MFVNVQTHMQFPSVTLHISRPDKPQVNYMVFGPGICADSNGVLSLEFMHGNTVRSEFLENGSKDMADCKRENPLALIHMYLDRSKEEPVFSNISQSETALLKEKVQSNDVEGMSQADQMIGWLAITERLCIYRWYPGVMNDAWTKMSDYMMQALSDTKTWGHLPYYRRLFEGLDIYGRDLDIEDMLQPPRWLIKTFKIEKGDNGETCVPNTWGEIPPPPVTFPNKETAIFLARLGTFRSIEADEREIRTRLDELAGRIEARFSQHRDNHNFFLVEMVVKLMATDGRTLQPAISTKVEIRIGQKTFSGRIVNDVRNKNTGLCALASGRNSKGLTEEAQYVSCYVIEDRTAMNRQLAGLCEPTNGMGERTEGVDFNNVFFNAPMQSQNPGWVTGSMTDKMQQRFGPDIARFALNEKQVEFIDKVMDNSVGLACLKGPPGTGKSYVLMALASSLMSADKRNKTDLGYRSKLLVTAPSNDAVDENLDNMPTRSRRQTQRTFLWREVQCCWICLLPALRSRVKM